jgi:hypothetical protein
MSKAIITPDDLFLLKEAIWPQVKFWDKQVEVIESVLLDKETFVPAAHEMGKDFVAGFIVPACFIVCAAKNVQCKILTSSATEKHLGNLWGEIDRFIRTSRAPLLAGDGGELIYNHQYMGRMGNADRTNGGWFPGGPVPERDSYVISAVVTSDYNGTGLSGHHPGSGLSLFVGDECSGMSSAAYDAAQGWADHMLLIGNPYPGVGESFFEAGVKAGDLVAA